MSKKVIIIGGSAAGPKTAAKVRRLQENADITIIEKGKFLSMASCGYPYFVGGVFDNRNMLLCTPTGVLRDPTFYMNAKAIKAETETEVIAINRAKKTVSCKRSNGEEFILSYDKLMISTGSIPRMPFKEGLELDGVTTLQSISDAEYLRKIRDEKKIRKAVIIGGGLIGIETAEALRLAGIEITIVEMADQVLPYLDWEIAAHVEKHLKIKGVNVFTGMKVEKLIGENGILTAVKLGNGTEIPCELAVVAIGVMPNRALAEKAGLEIGPAGGIKVNSYLQTSDPDIYAAGDCIEVNHIITQKQTYSPMGDLANLQGRIAAENMINGPEVKFSGTIQTAICRIFEYSAGATGCNEKAAKAAGYDVETVIISGPDKPGFMNGLLLISKMVADRKTGKLIGFQCTGPGDVSKQVAQAALAIKGGLTINDLRDLDLPYAPPFSLAVDNFIACAHAMENKLLGRMKGISAREVRQMKCEKTSEPFILDVRGPDEFETMRLGIGEVLIPLGALRKRISELPADKNHEIITFCKISLRGYEAALILSSFGYTNVKVLEGGIMAWPFDREK